MKLDRTTGISFRKEWIILLFHLTWIAGTAGYSSLLAADNPPDSLLQIFPLVESRSLLPDIDDSYGVVFRDLDRDDYPDLYVVRFRNLNRLFTNTGGALPLSDWTIQSGLGGNLMPMGLKNLELGAAAADLNNDGLPDLVIAGWGESTRLFVQNENLQFSDITRSAGIDLPLDGNGAFWADINNDGYLDLFITDEHHPNRLLLGNGRGKFTDVSQQWGLSENRVSQGAAFGDLDGDGFPDLYVCNWFAEDELYRNTGRNQLERVRVNIPHLTDSLNSNGITLGDIDGDGDLDLLVTDRNGKSALYRNDIRSGDSHWKLVDITDSSRLFLPYPAYGTVIADFNNDGRADIWVSSIGPNQLFLQDHNRHFVKAFQGEYQMLPHPRYYSTGAAVADLDRDGDLDLFVSNKDTNSILYINPTNNDRFIQIKIVGVRSNRDAIGTRIWLYKSETASDSSSLRGYREISAGGGYLSQNDLRVHFGLAEQGQYHARILFPSGKLQLLNHLENGRKYTVYEYSGILKAYFRLYYYFHRVTGTPHFGLNILLYIILIAGIILYVLFATWRYLWAPRHVVFFFSSVIVMLYGIFIALQENPLHWRLIIQIFTLSGLFLLLSFFMEKIRRLEISRRKYRILLQEFSQKLIFIKSNTELSEKLIETIDDLVQPRFCAFYTHDQQQLRLAQHRGTFTAPAEVSLTGEQYYQYLKQDFDVNNSLYRPEKLTEGYHFPIARDRNFYGLLVIAQPFQRRQFSPEDIEVFRTLTGQTAIAIENNHYIEDSKKLIRQITEAQTREKYTVELEKANQKLKVQNRKLKKLYEDLKNTQSQLIQSEKMASLGQLVAGIAHELNNPISYIYANMKTLDGYTTAITQLLSLLQKSSPSEQNIAEFAASLQQIKSRFDLEFIQQDIHNLIRESVEGSDRVKRVVQNLRNFSRLDEGDFKLVDVHEGLESTLLLLNNEIKNRIILHKNYGQIPKIHCHPGNLNQVFMNILLNAIQAIENRGNIWITTAKSQSYILIRIRDDGRGIPSRFQGKIFDPFFTTKPVGKGTGLGLSICYNIIQAHQGKINFTSREGEGTEFVIQLPVAPKKISGSAILASPGEQ